MIRVIGSHDISTTLPLVGLDASRVTGHVSTLLPSPAASAAGSRVVSSARLWRHFGSLFTVWFVMPRSARMNGPYGALTASPRASRRAARP